MNALRLKVFYGACGRQTARSAVVSPLYRRLNLGCALPGRLAVAITRNPWSTAARTNCLPRPVEQPVTKMTGLSVVVAGDMVKKDLVEGDERSFEAEADFLPRAFRGSRRDASSRYKSPNLAMYRDALHPLCDALLRFQRHPATRKDRCGVLYRRMLRISCLCRLLKATTCRACLLFGSFVLDKHDSSSSRQQPNNLDCTCWARKSRQDHRHAPISR